MLDKNPPELVPQEAAAWEWFRSLGSPKYWVSAARCRVRHALPGRRRRRCRRRCRRRRRRLFVAVPGAQPMR